MIQGINGAPFVDMTPYLDVGKLESLFIPIARGLAQCGPIPPAYFPRKTKNRSYKDMNDLGVCDDISIKEEYETTLKQLRPAQKLRFAELANGVLVGGSHVSLRYPIERDYKDIFYQDKCKDNVAAQALFPELMSFVKTLPFESIGRIIIFVSNPYIEGQIHSDTRDSKPDLFSPLSLVDAYKDNNFIWFNPSGKKNFFVYDEEKDLKVPFTSKACFFNTWDFHGSEASPITTFSFRVDGKFKPELKQKLGI